MPSLLKSLPWTRNWVSASGVVSLAFDEMATPVPVVPAANTLLRMLPEETGPVIVVELLEVNDGPTVIAVNVPLAPAGNMLPGRWMILLIIFTWADDSMLMAVCGWPVVTVVVDEPDDPMAPAPVKVLPMTNALLSFS